MTDFEIIEALIARDNEVTQVFVYDGSVEISSLTLQETEVDEVRWFGLEEVRQEIQTDRSRFCVPAASLDVLKEYLTDESI